MVVVVHMQPKNIGVRNAPGFGAWSVAGSTQHSVNNQHLSVKVREEKAQPQTNGYCRLLLACELHLVCTCNLKMVDFQPSPRTSRLVEYKRLCF